MSLQTDVRLDASVYSLDVINSAAYRLIAEASCNIEMQAGFYFCSISLKDPNGDAEATKLRFLDLLTDERLRDRLDKETHQMRNLIVSLAFGALAAQQEE
jgi:His-Xaa-Ser system protein HxsD